jgi:hypothetical protein
MAHRRVSKRRGRDSNPRYGLSRIQHFQCCSFGHSDTSPRRRYPATAGGESYRGFSVTTNSLREESEKWFDSELHGFDLFGGLGFDVFVKRVAVGVDRDDERAEVFDPEFP